MPIPHTSASPAVTALFRAIGAILVIVSAIHFAVTPVLMRNVVDPIGARADAAAAKLLHESFLLNHLVVGVLLLPIGLCTLFAAGGIARGDRFARQIGWTITLAILVLPGVIAAVMGSREIMSGGPFTIAAGLVVLAALALAAGMWRTRAIRR